MSSLPRPRAPSSLVKTARWTLLALGIFYGSMRQKVLATKEAAHRAKVEAERPAREAAAKAAKDKVNREEMAYLARETGIAGNNSKMDSDYKSACGCSY